MPADNSRKWNPALKSPKSRTPVKLPEGLEKRLLAYTIAAGAGLMVSSQPATAGIVWTEASTSIVPNTPLPLNVDGDGTDDFNIKLNIGANSASLSMTAPVSGNGVVATTAASFPFQKAGWR